MRFSSAKPFTSKSNVLSLNEIVRKFCEGSLTSVYLRVPLIRTNDGQQSFYCRWARPWNQISFDAKTALSEDYEKLLPFCTSVIHFLFALSYYPSLNLIMSIQR